MRTKISAAALTVFALVALPVASTAQDAAPPASPADALVQEARDAATGQIFAATVATLVRRANDRPSDYATAASQFLTEMIRGGDAFRRAVAVDALKSLPSSSREGFVAVLVELIRGGGDTPETRLFVRGLGEVGANGTAALRELLNAGSLSGKAADWARWYTRG